MCPGASGGGQRQQLGPILLLQQTLTLSSQGHEWTRTPEHKHHSRQGPAFPSQSHLPVSDRRRKSPFTTHWVPGSHSPSPANTHTNYRWPPRPPEQVNRTGRCHVCCQDLCLPSAKHTGLSRPLASGLSKINVMTQILKGQPSPAPVMPELGKTTSLRPAWTAQADHRRMGMNRKKQPGRCQNTLSGRCFGNGSQSCLTFTEHCLEPCH